MVRQSYKNIAIKNIKNLFSNYEESLPKIIRRSGMLELETTKIMKLDWREYDKGKLIGYIRGLVETFNLTDEDFK